MNISENKDKYSQYYTTKNPFKYDAIHSWVGDSAKSGISISEPFYGAGDLMTHFKDTFKIKNAKYNYYDIEPSSEEVVYNDSLKNIPKCDLIITNPPYGHTSTIHKTGIDRATLGGFSNVYLKALDTCLLASENVLAIIPASFISDGSFRDRIHSLVIPTELLFNDTEVPIVLAMFTKDGSDNPGVYSGNKLIGYLNDILKIHNEILGDEVPESPKGKEHNMMLACIDSPNKKAHFKVWDGRDCKGSRAFFSFYTELTIEELNNRLESYRRKTGDILLCPFRGYRKDGGYRMRISFKNSQTVNLPLIIRSIIRF